MTSHVTAETLERFARGNLDDAALSEVLLHLENCDACARAGEDRAAEDLATLRAEWSATPARAAWRAPGWTIAAAAAIVIAVSILLLVKRPTKPDHPRTITTTTPLRRTAEPPLSPTVRQYDDPEWQRLVAQTLESGRLPFPKDLAMLTAPPDTVRSGSGSVEAISPFGVVVDEIRPAFTWPAEGGGIYTVFVFDGERQILRSPVLHAARWTPDRDLPRSRTLTWQVEVTGRDSFETIPSPPTPLAKFRIVSEKEHHDLMQARQRHPHDDLLLAVLQARSGMRAEALSALRRAAAGDDAAKRILDHETSTTPQ